jgi:hypothetical protein
MKEFDIEDIVSTLLGPITFDGESHHDSQSLTNMDDYQELIYNLLEKFFKRVPQRFDYRASG